MNHDQPKPHAKSRRPDAPIDENLKPPDKQERATQAVLEQAEVRSQD